MTRTISFFSLCLALAASAFLPTVGRAQATTESSAEQVDTASGQTDDTRTTGDEGDLDAVAPPASSEGKDTPDASADDMNSGDDEAIATTDDVALGDAELSADEAALLAELSGASGAEAAMSGASAESRLRIYGFADTKFQYVIGSQSERALYWAQGGAYPSFVMGNLNLYLDAQMGPNVRALSEVRFHIAPMNPGSAAGQFTGTGEPAYNEARSPDPNDFGRDFRYGYIEIERAHVEYVFHPLLTVRTGIFVTPYGIWNVDHGSPTILSVRRPYVIGEELFPETQLGIELLGSTSAGSGTLGYHLTVSNGRGPISRIYDLDANKAIGGRVYYEMRDAVHLKIGASGYWGTYGDTRLHAVSLAPKVEAGLHVYESYKELAFGADLQLEYANVLVQGEVITRQLAYETGRPEVSVIGATGSTYVPDSLSIGAYGIVGYRIRDWNLTPYVLASLFDAGTRTRFNGSAMAGGFSGGLTFRPEPSLTVKGVFTYLTFFDSADGSATKDISQKVVEVQTAWAF